jgi:hypothetical protein
MGKVLIQATGRRKMRRLWWAPWRSREVFEICFTLAGQRYGWYTEDYIRANLPHRVNEQITRIVTNRDQ